jgi:Fumble
MHSWHLKSCSDCLLRHALYCDRTQEPRPSSAPASSCRTSWRAKSAAESQSTSEAHSPNWSSSCRRQTMAAQQGKRTAGPSVMTRKREVSCIGPSTANARTSVCADRRVSAQAATTTVHCVLWSAGTLQFVKFETARMDEVLSFIESHGLLSPTSSGSVTESAPAAADIQRDGSSEQGSHSSARVLATGGGAFKFATHFQVHVLIVGN